MRRMPCTLAGQGLNVGLADVAEAGACAHHPPLLAQRGDSRLLRQYERARKADFALRARPMTHCNSLPTPAPPCKPCATGDAA